MRELRIQPYRENTRGGGGSGELRYLQLTAIGSQNSRPAAQHDAFASVQVRNSPAIHAYYVPTLRIWSSVSPTSSEFRRRMVELPTSQLGEEICLSVAYTDFYRCFSQSNRPSAIEWSKVIYGFFFYAVQLGLLPRVIFALIYCTTVVHDNNTRPDLQGFLQTCTKVCGDRVTIW